MNFDWREYLRLAQFLQGNLSTSYSEESAFRCAVSRAYYACFCHARNYARDHLDYSPQNNVQDHRSLRQHYQDKDMTDVATKLDQLRQWRNRCDYNDHVPNLSRILNSTVVAAKSVIKLLKP